MLSRVSKAAWSRRRLAVVGGNEIQSPGASWPADGRSAR